MALLNNVGSYRGIPAVVAGWVLVVAAATVQSWAFQPPAQPQPPKEGGSVSRLPDAPAPLTLPPPPPPLAPLTPLSPLTPVGDSTGGDGWIPMFDGSTLDGWQASENPGAWSVRDGVLTGTGFRSHLFYMKQQCTDCEFKADVRLNHAGNSGMYFRAAFSPGRLATPTP
jgi:hypothetical protein